MENGLRDYLQILHRRRWIVIAFCIISTVTVAVASFVVTPLYRGTTTVVIEGEDTDVISSYEKAPSYGASFDIYENYLNTQMTMIRSRSVAGKVFDKHGLSAHPRYLKSKDPLAVFIKDITLERIKGSRIMKISVDNPSPQASAELANDLAEAYAQDNLMRRALTFIRNQRMASLNAEFLRLQARHDELSQHYGPKHPEMIALTDEIRTMSKRIESARFAEAHPEAAGAAQESQALLEDALLKIQESSVMSSSRMNNIVISDRAVVPKERQSPKRILNIAIAFAGGLVGGVFLAFFTHYLDDTVKSEDDLKRAIGKKIFLGALLSEKKHSSNLKTLGHIDRLTAERPDSASSEAYRLVRTRLLWSMDKGQKLKDIGVYSSIPGEGKTTVASNLAIALTQLGQKVLLVDTDIRRGRVHETYNVLNDKGLGNFLSENLRLENIVQATEIPGLSVVSCGKSIIDSSQLFSSPRMAEFVKHAREKFDHVIYDMPPIVVIADTAILISQLDGAVLVTRNGLTGARVLSKALSLTDESKANLIGVVLNDSSFGENQKYSQYYNNYRRKS